VCFESADSTGDQFDGKPKKSHETKGTPEPKTSRLFSQSFPVDILDLDALGQNWGTQSGATWEMGDFNEDGVIDILDLDILGQNWGAGANDFTNALDGITVPEPLSVSILALGGLVLLRRKTG
jgi:hypothetical protein